MNNYLKANHNVSLRASPQVVWVQPRKKSERNEYFSNEYLNTFALWKF